MSDSNSHHHDHSHDHQHHHHGHIHSHHSSTGNIRTAFFLNLIFCIIEFVGGTMIGSLAIMADAVHDFGDTVSLGLAWFLERLARRESDQKFNFGYRRFSLLSALISGVVITSGSIVIIIESITRFQQPHAPSGPPMMGLAILGLAVNGWAAFRLSKGHTQNEKVLTWHLVEDVLGWLAILIGAVIIWLTGVTWLDPVLAIALAGFVFLNVVRNLKATAYLFLQGKPLNFDETEFVSKTLSVGGIEHIDHVAVWSLDGQANVLSARLHLHSVRDPNEIEKIKAQVRSIAAHMNAEATLETCLAEHC